VDVADVVDRSRRLEDEGKWREALDLLKEAAREEPGEVLELEIATLCSAQGWRTCQDPWLAEYSVPGAAHRVDVQVSDREAMDLFAEGLTWADLPELRAGLAAVHWRRGEEDRAWTHLRAALDENPEHPPALVLLGRVQLARGDLDQAGEAFARAVQEAPGFGAGYVGLGESLWRSGRKKEALAAFDQGVSMCRGNDPAYSTLAGLLAGDGEYGRALTIWKRALEVNYQNAEAWRGVALESARAGNALEASQALDQAFALDAEGTASWVRARKTEFPLLGEGRA
jgi:tetratricopeptide (TPR) repeat protein